ncbi:polysaccharide biosynthesis tyrosine autokinase [Maribellus luteus]|uniref:non-specific protein-tyrosine kinase n=1 Tax=Maribellus luteus TaxID=2305463 RepID=A0A399T116_9BACT|nr:polysaccharide biosynthesis tyrosine autokinase [Maribellus luteus]RIJ47623.1 polysaccharide biosynthesis tyrosine autokinase [Maribellus luteus]
MSDNTLNTQSLTSIQEDEIDIKRLIFLVLGKWYWLAICLFLGLAGAYFYVKYTPKKFQVDTSLLVTNEQKGLDVQNMFMESMMGGTNKVMLQNEIEFLHSYTLTNQAINNLNWQTFWQQKNVFVWNGIYLNDPYMLNKAEGALNPEGVSIFITPLSSTQFRVEADDELLIENQPVKIKFNEVADYNKPFKNEYFGFTLHPKENPENLIGKEYKFSFIDKNKLTLSYLKKVNANFSKDSEVIKLSLESTEPLRDIHYLNELVRVYLEQKLELKTQTQKRSLDFIDSQLSGISSDLNKAENTFTEFRSRNQIIDLSSQGSLIMEQLKEIEKEKSQLQMQLEYFKSLQRYLGNIQSADQLIAPSVVGITDASLNSLVIKLSDLYSRRKIMEFSARQNNPTLILMNQEIEQITVQLREILVNLVQNTEVSVKALNDRYNRINKQLNNMPEQEQQLINIQRQYDLTNEIYTFLLQRRAELEISLAAAVVDIHIIDPARYERLVPINKSTLLILLIGAFLGLLIPALIILIQDFFDNSIQLQEDVEKLTPLSILGNVFHSKNNSELVVIKDPAAAITESYRTIRTNLQYKFTSPNQKIIGLHSVQPSEGKTFTSINLASILAMNDKKTVLIGADMRKPRLHRIFNLNNKSGLSTYLTGQNEINEIIRPSQIEHLSVITSGPIPPNPAELLEREAFKKLLDTLKSQFDYIIIDNAPVSRVTDGLITSKSSELNLFVLRYKVSKKDQLKFINEIAGKGGMNNPALIINDVKISRLSYGYSYSYKHAYGKGYSD